MPTLRWVNVYDVVQYYGGAEEGGWYYDVGIPEWSHQGLCSCPPGEAHRGVCPIFHLLVEAKTWIAGFKPGYLESFTSGDPEEPEHRGEAVHGRKEIKVEEQTGHAYPEEQPIWE